MCGESHFINSVSGGRIGTVWLRLSKTSTPNGSIMKIFNSPEAAASMITLFMCGSLKLYPMIIKRAPGAVRWALNSS